MKQGESESKKEREHYMIKYMQQCEITLKTNMMNQTISDYLYIIYFGRRAFLIQIHPETSPLEGGKPSGHSVFNHRIFAFNLFM